MKKILLLCGAIFIIATSKSFSQLNAGIIGGINVASFHVENDDVSNRTLWGIGSVINYPLNDDFSIQAEPMYLKKGGIREQVDDDPKLTFDLSFFEIPILLKYSLGDKNKVFLITGPTMGYLLTSDLEADVNGIIFSADLKKITETIDLGVCVGGGFSVEVHPGTLFLQGKYTFGLTNLAKNGKFTAEAGPLELEGELDSKESKYKTRGLQLSVGFMIPI